MALPDTSPGIPAKAPHRLVGCLTLLGALLLLFGVAALVLAQRVSEQAARVRVGRVESFPPGSVTPLWLNGETISPRSTGMPPVLWLVHGDDGFLALYTNSPEEQAHIRLPGAQAPGWPQPPVACGVQWRPYDRQFVEPCTGSVFDERGRVISGSSPRGLDRFRVTTDGESVLIDARRVEPGPPREDVR